MILAAFLDVIAGPLGRLSPSIDGRLSASFWVLEQKSHRYSNIKSSILNLYHFCILSASLRIQRV